MTIALQSKRAAETRRYRHDWSPFLGTDTISSHSTSIVGATLSTAVETGNQSVVFTVSAGVAGTPATITHTITTAAGDIETEVFTLPIGYDEPVSLREAKAQVRMIEDDSEDEFIASLIPSARAFVERRTRYSFVSGTRTEVFGAFGDFLEIAWRNISAVGPDITYTDEAGSDATYSAFLAKLGRYPLRIYPAIDDSFPTLGDGGSISVPITLSALDTLSTEYICGKRAMLLLIGFWFDNRGEAPLTKEQELAFECALEDLTPVSAY